MILPVYLLEKFHIDVVKTVKFFLKRVLFSVALTLKGIVLQFCMLFKMKDLILCLEYFCVLIINYFARLFCFNCSRFAHFLNVSDTILLFKSVWSFNILRFEIFNSAGRTCDLRRISRQRSNLRRI